MNLKDEFIKYIDMGDYYASRNIIEMMMNQYSKSEGDFYFINKIIEKNISKSPSHILREVKIAVISSYAIKGLDAFLKVIGYLYGYNINTYFVPYGQYELETILKDSFLYDFEPNIIIESIDVNDFVEHFHVGLASKADIEKGVDMALALIERINNNIRRKGKEVPIIISNFSMPFFSVREYSMSTSAKNIAKIIDDANKSLNDLYTIQKNYYIFDENYFRYIFGQCHIFDNSSSILSQNPISMLSYKYYAMEYIKYLNSIYKKSYKCIAVDADDTLWGGVVGEVGLRGIKIERGYPGDFYREMQLKLKKLKEQGILLILLSKNNLEDVKEVFFKNEHMILKYEDFVAIKANWKEKYINLKETMQELNLGLDSVVFLDNSPFERSMMRKFLPEVLTLEMPKDSAKYGLFMEFFSFIENDSISIEDMNRSKTYKAELERGELKRESKTKEEFYYNLEISCEFGEVKEKDFDRIASMISRTNQFNLSTKRYTIQDVRRLWKDDRYFMCYVKYCDKFGDNGMIAFALVDKEKYEDGYFIDSFMISCRVIGKTIEDYLLKKILKKTIADGKTYLYGIYNETSKNQLVKNFYKDRFFEEEGKLENVELWKGNVKKIKIQDVPWIRETKKNF